MLKRLADWMEKMSVAAFAVGLFQQDIFGILVGGAAFSWSMWLTIRLEEDE